MSKFEKDLRKLKQNPKNVHFEELEKILLRFGFTKRQRGSSHVVFTKGKSADRSNQKTVFKVSLCQTSIGSN